MSNAAVSEHIRALQDPDIQRRIQAVSDLVAIGQPALEPLIAGLPNSSAEARWRAIVALGWIGDPKAIEALLTGLGDSVWEVRQNAAWALGQIADTRTAEALLKAMHDQDEQVTVLAAYALARMGDIQRLQSALLDEHELARRAASAGLHLLLNNYDSVRHHQTN